MRYIGGGDDDDEDRQHQQRQQDFLTQLRNLPDDAKLFPHNLDPSLLSWSVLAELGEW